MNACSGWKVLMVITLFGAPVAAQEAVVDDAPSGTENQVIFEGERSSIGHPGADSAVTETGVGTRNPTIEFDTGAGPGGPYDADSGTTTIIYSGGGGGGGNIHDKMISPSMEATIETKDAN